MAITATRTTTFRPGGDQDNDGFVDFGDVLRHTLVITNTATNATGVVVNDPLNGSTLTGTVNVSPIAFDDNFTAVGNTLLVVGGPNLSGDPASVVVGNLMSNDVEFFGDTFSITGNTAAANGTVNVNADGTFTYISNAGFEGIDTFTYTVTDSQGLTGTATVSITVGGAAGQVWYVDSNYAGVNGASDGTSLRPFTSLMQLNGANGDGSTNDDVDGTGDVIYVEGAGGTSGGIVLENGQQLVGTGVDLVVGGFTLATATGNSLVNAASGTLVTLATGNTVAGIALGNGTGSATAISGTGFGTLTVNGVAINVGGQALSLNTGAFAGTGFTSTTSTGGVNNVNLQTVTGNVNLGGGTLSGATSNAVVINGGNGSFDYNGSITHTANGHAIQVLNKTGGTVDFDGAVNSNTQSDGVFLSTNTGATINFDGGLTINTSASDTTGFQATGGGTISVTGSNSINSDGGTAIDLNGVTVGASGITFNSITTAGANGVLLNAVGQAVGSSGIDILGGTITNASVRGVDINATSADVAIGASISTTGTGRSVEVSNSGGTGGTQITFSGAIDDNGLGISLDNNDQSGGATINFTGGLDIDSTINTGFNAVAGGTINVTGVGNTIDTTSGIGLNIANTNIGASDLTFQRISSGGGANVGISLDTTGSAGGLHVTGTGAAGSGGTIQNKVGADGSISAGIGIYLNNTAEAQFNNMQLNGFQNHAIRGTDVNGLSFTNSVINGTSGNNAAGDEGAIFLANSSGTILIQNSQISGGFEDNLQILYNSGTPDIATYNIWGNTFTALQAAGQNAMINLRSTTAASAGSNVTFNIGSPTDSTLGNTFSNSANETLAGGTVWWADGVLVTLEGGFQHTVNIDNNTFDRLFQAVDFAANFNADVNGRIYSNDITRTEGVAAIAFGTGSSSTSAMLFQMLVEDNIIGGLGNDTGSRQGLGIIGDFRGAETARVTLHQNQIRDTEINGIQVISQAATGDGDLHLRITNNVIDSIDDDINSGIVHGIEVTSNSATNGDIFLTISGNDSSSVATFGGYDIRVRQATVNNTFQLEDFAGNGTVAGDVQAYLAAQNPGNTTNVRTGGSVVQYTSMNFNNANTPAPFTPLMVQAPPPEQNPGSAPVVDRPTAGGVGSAGDLAPGGTPVAGPVVVDDGVVSQAELALIVEAAIDRWAAAGASAAQLAAMRAVTVTVEDISGLFVGLSDAGRITLDHNAAGYNWFIDATPGDDSEFDGAGTLLNAAAGTEAGNRVDLLTTVMHELGHQIGLGDTYATGDAAELMYGLIAIGQRRLPGADDAGAGTVAPAADGALALVPINLGTIPAGKTVTITWDSIVDGWGAGLTPTYTNASTITGSNPGAFSVNSNTETLSSTSTLALDSLTLGGTVWNDDGAGGGTRGDGQLNGTEAGVGGVLVTLFVDNGTVAGVWDASDTLVVSTTTNGSGVYSFTGLGPGDYLVRIDQDNFDAGGNVSLLNLQASSGTTPEPLDPDDDVDGDDNGSRTPGQPAYSNAITLAFDSEPTADGSGKFDVNTTLDFGFLAPQVEPTLTATALNPTYVENAAAADLFSTVAASTVDAGQTFTSLTLTVSNVTDGAAEVLTFDGSSVALTNGNAVTTATNGLNVSVSLAAGTATVTFAGATLSQAALQTLVDGLAYRNTSEDPTDANRVVTITQLVDSGSNTAPDDNTAALSLASTVNVNPVNDAPAGGDETIVLNEDDVHPFSLADFNFSDTDGDSLAEVVLTTLPANGTLYLNGVAISLAGTAIAAADITAGLLTFEPAANANGTGYASFTFQVRDNGGVANGGANLDPTPNTMTIDVTAVNDAPVNTVGATVNATEDDVNVVLSTTGAAMSVSDLEATGLVIYSLSVSNGTLTIRTDVVGGITAGDIQPVPGTGNGTSALAISATISQINTTLAALNGLLYTPDPDFDGTDTLEVYLNDAGQTGLDPNPISILPDPLIGPATEEDFDTRSIVMSPVNDAPVAQNDAVTTAENLAGTGSVFADNGSGADTDPDDPLTVSAVNGVGGNVGVPVLLASGALLTVNANGTYSYNPNGAFNYLVSSATAAATSAVNSTATDSFTYTLAGGNTATVTVTVTGVSSADDELWGSPGNNTIVAGPLSDVLFNLSQGGNDSATGSAGNDRFYFGAAFDGSDQIDGGAGTRDVLILQGSYTLTLGATSLTGIEYLSLQSGSVGRWGDTSGASYSYDITMHEGNTAPGQQLFVNAQSLQVGETFTFDGSAETDGGRFLIYGGRDTDTLTGGSGNDVFYFEQPRWNATDTIDGGDGMDAVVLSFGNGLNTITIGAGQLTSIESLSVNNRFAADPSQTPSYALILSDGNVAAGETLILNGQSLEAGQTFSVDGSAITAGRLRIYGGDDADVFVGGAGNDQFHGGGGADTFAFRTAASTSVALPDEILDFEIGSDTIDLSQLDAIAGGADDGFTFVGATAFSNTAGELRAELIAGVWHVEGDLDGIGGADFAILVTATTATPLAATDFVL